MPFNSLIFSMYITHQTVIITGAASGIGRALLVLLARYEGVKIVAADRNAKALKDAISGVASTKNQVLAFVGDLSLPETTDTLLAFTEKHFEWPQIFIANAGFANYEAADAQSDWISLETIFRLNTLVPIYGFRQWKTRSVGGYYLITASAMSFTGIPGFAVYAATKAALHRFADTYWVENQQDNDLGLVYPVSTKSNFFNAATQRDIPPQPWPVATPEAVAEAMLKGILGNRKRVFPSVLFRVARLPILIFEWLAYPYQSFYKKTKRNLSTDS